MNINLELTDVDLASDRSAIFNPLLRYNESKVGDPSLIPLNILITGDKDDTPLGGLWACTAYGWLSIELLYIPEQLRLGGIGKSILDTAESEATLRGCHSARVDTHEFQGALGFYKKCGYNVYGELPDYPAGHTRYFLKKGIQ